MWRFLNSKTPQNATPFQTPKFQSKIKHKTPCKNLIPNTSYTQNSDRFHRRGPIDILLNKHTYGRKKGRYMKAFYDTIHAGYPVIMTNGMHIFAKNPHYDTDEPDTPFIVNDENGESYFGEDIDEPKTTAAINVYMSAENIAAGNKNAEISLTEIRDNIYGRHDSRLDAVITSNNGQCTIKTENSGEATCPANAQDIYIELLKLCMLSHRDSLKNNDGGHDIFAKFHIPETASSVQAAIIYSEDDGKTWSEQIPAGLIIKCPDKIDYLPLQGDESQTKELAHNMIEDTWRNGFNTCLEIFRTGHISTTENNTDTEGDKNAELDTQHNNDIRQ